MPTKSLPLNESIAIEQAGRDTGPASSKIRMRLFNAEVVRRSEIAAIGASSGLLDMVLKELRRLGYSVVGVSATDTEPSPGFKLANPKHVPTAAQLTANRTERARRTGGGPKRGSQTGSTASVVLEVAQAAGDAGFVNGDVLDHMRVPKAKREARRKTVASSLKRLLANGELRLMEYGRYVIADGPGTDLAVIPPATPQRHRGRPRGPLPVPVMPQLTETLTVVMLAYDPDTGEARIGLRDTHVAWEVTVEAQHFIQRPVEAE